jgi:hypothetical protein
VGEAFVLTLGKITGVLGDQNLIVDMLGRNLVGRVTILEMCKGHQGGRTKMASLIVREVIGILRGA